MKKTAITVMAVLLTVVSMLFVSCSNDAKEPAKFTVTVVKEDGTVIDKAEVTDGEKYTLPAADKVEGYTIVSFSDGEKDDYKPGDEVVIKKDMKFTAKLEAVKGNYEITIMCGDVKYFQQPYASGTEVTLPETFTSLPEGYRIVSYSDGTKTYNPDDKIKVTGDITLTVTVALKEYTVTFMNDTTELKKVTVQHGKTVASKDFPENPTKDGYIFQNWKIKDTTSRFTADTVITGSITVEAVWATESAAKYKVHFKYVDATRTADAATMQDITENGYATEPAAPTIDGLKFAGWYKSSSTLEKVDLAGDAFDFDSTPITKETYLYAKYILTPESLCTKWYKEMSGEQVPFIIGTCTGTDTITGRVSSSMGSGAFEVGTYYYDTNTGEIKINFEDFFALMMSNLQGGLIINKDSSSGKVTLGSSYTTTDTVTVTDNEVNVAGTWKADSGKWTEKIVLSGIDEGKDEGTFQLENIMYKSDERTGDVVASLKTTGGYKISTETGSKSVTFMEYSSTGYSVYGTVTNEYIGTVMFGYSKDRVELSGLLGDFSEIKTSTT